jgi:stage II sporulation protein P
MNKSILKKSKLIITYFLVTILAMTCIVHGAAEKTDGFAKELYLKVLYSSVPYLKMVNENGESAIDTFHESFLYMLGIDINNPLSVIEKEVAYMNFIPQDDDKITEKNGDEELQPYKLGDGEVAINSENDNSKDTGSNDITNLQNRIVTVYDPKLKKQLNAAKPEVLIYHSHTSEAYKPVEGAFSDDKDLNVCAVGDAIASELQNNYGISVIHDTTKHDTNYVQGYSKSSATLKNYLKKYKSFKVIIDLHRDGGVNKSIVTTKMNDENVAKMMFVISKASSRYKKTLALEENLMDISNELFPGFCRGIHSYDHGTGNFNQDKSNNVILIEVGSDANSSDEAKASAKYIARVIGQYINGRN